MKIIDYRIAALLVITLCVFVGIFFIEPIAQDDAYHLFADKRLLLGIPNFWDVASNGAYLFVGIYGIVVLFTSSKKNLVTEIKWVYYLFFIGVVMIGFGSAYYHLAPTNQTLLWDRLPMTIAFMAFFTIILAEFVSIRFAKIVFPPLLLVGIYSVLYWQYSELQGHGDLRLYGAVQFLPMLLVPLILLMYKPSFDGKAWIWGLLGMYFIAKLLELYDRQIYEAAYMLSGHTLKHLVSAVGSYLFLLALRRRHSIPASPA